jgi:hypothetical protein
VKSALQLEMEAYATDFDRLCRESGMQHFTIARTVYEVVEEVMQGMLTVQHKYIDPASGVYALMSIDVVSEDSCSPVIYSIVDIVDTTDGESFHGVVSFAPHTKDQFTDMLVIMQDYYGFRLAND